MADLKPCPLPEDGTIAALLAERQRQIGKGYDASHDDRHRGGEIINSSWGAIARIYAAQDCGQRGDADGYKRYLIQAAAQIIAECQRVDRLAGGGDHG